MIVLGIDPGVHGALALYCPEEKRLWCGGLIDMPTTSAKRGKSALDVDGRVLSLMLTNTYGGKRISRVVVEQVQSRPRQGGQFAFGVNYGRILGVIEALGLPLLNVSAQKWKQAMGLRGQDKGMSVRLACELFPEYKSMFFGPRGAELDGRAEAALLAYWGAKQK